MKPQQLFPWHGLIARGRFAWARRPLDSFILALWLFVGVLKAQPTLDHTSPAAISPKGGQITLHGTGLNQPLSLWSTPAAKATFSATSPNSVTCQLTFDKPIHDQFLALRVATASGISNPILIAIDDLPTIAADGKHKSLKDVRPITIPSALDGTP